MAHKHSMRTRSQHALTAHTCVRRPERRRRRCCCAEPPPRAAPASPCGEGGGGGVQTGAQRAGCEACGTQGPGRSAQAAGVACRRIKRPSASRAPSRDSRPGGGPHHSRRAHPVCMSGTGTSGGEQQMHAANTARRCAAKLAGRWRRFLRREQHCSSRSQASLPAAASVAATPAAHGCGAHRELHKRWAGSW